MIFAIGQLSSFLRPLNKKSLLNMSYIFSIPTTIRLLNGSGGSFATI